MLEVIDECKNYDLIFSQDRHNLNLGSKVTVASQLKIVLEKKFVCLTKN